MKPGTAGFNASSLALHVRGTEEHKNIKMFEEFAR